MRNRLLISLIAVVALCGCDNPEEFTHPENPKKPGSITVVPTDTTTAPETTSTPPAVPRDGSPVKTGDAQLSGEFDNLNISAPLEVQVTVGSPTKVSVECSERSFDDIKLDISDTTLNISTTSSFNATAAVVRVTMPKLSNVVTSGTALVKIHGVSSPSFNVTASGVSSVEAFGAADTINVSATGSCCVRMKGLQAKVGSVTCSDKCAIEVRTSDEINATSSGTSAITIFGQPRKVNKHKTDKSFIGLATN